MDKKCVEKIESLTFYTSSWILNCKALNPCSFGPQEAVSTGLVLIERQCNGVVRSAGTVIVLMSGKTWLLLQGDTTLSHSLTLHLFTHKPEAPLWPQLSRWSGMAMLTPPISFAKRGSQG